MLRNACVPIVYLMFALACLPVAGAELPNLLLITVDDMNADSVGVYGSAVPGTTPSIDRLASQGMRFDMAHVQVANCAPSRNVMWSGRYPHSNKVLGFYQVREPGYPVLADLMSDAGYFTAIRHKTTDSTPYHPYPWDMILDTNEQGEKLDKRDAQSFGQSTRRLIEAAKKAGKPFSLLVNVSDPHVPFVGFNRKGNPIDDPYVPSRSFTPAEVAVPGFLPDDAVVREELAHYYSSVRRADDTVGEVLRALEEGGMADNTLVLLLSDHGMPFPFAKTQLYHHSTRTPLIVRWPGVIKSGAVDTQHMVSAVDILPTLLSAIGAAVPEGVEGRSFLPLLKGQVQENRQRVFKEYHETAGGSPAPSRAVESPGYLYVFNPWSDGQYAMKSATTSTKTFKRMQEMAKTDKAMAERVSFYFRRTVEEFYDVEADPDCLNNLIAAPDHAQRIESFRDDMQYWMVQTDDPMVNTLAVWRTEQRRTDYVSGLIELARQKRDYKAAVIKAIQAGKEAAAASEPKPPAALVD
jgi:N-sulfoglucosamine sulfohydrolase